MVRWAQVSPTTPGLGQDGEPPDVGDRVLRAVRPPIFDSPTTRGLDDAAHTTVSVPADAHDLAALSRIADTADWDVAARAVELIVTRGYAHGRDLSALLAELRAEGPY